MLRRAAAKYLTDINMTNRVKKYKNEHHAWLLIYN